MVPFGLISVINAYNHLLQLPVFGKRLNTLILRFNSSKNRSNRFEVFAMVQYSLGSSKYNAREKLDHFSGQLKIKNAV